MATLTVTTEKHDGYNFCGELAAAGFPVSAHDYESVAGSVVLTIPSALNASGQAVVDAHPKPVPPPPDVQGFVRAVIDTFGLENSNGFLSKYNLFILTLNSGNFADARATIQMARTNGDLSAANVTTLSNLADTYNIP